MSEDRELDWKAIAQERSPRIKIPGDGRSVRGDHSRRDTVRLFSTILERATKARPIHSS